MEKFKIHIVTYVSMLVMAVTSILYTTISQHHTEQKFCNIINTVNDAYDKAPEPTTQLGRDLKQNYRQLEADLDCRERNARS